MRGSLSIDIWPIEWLSMQGLPDFGLISAGKTVCHPAFIVLRMTGSGLIYDTASEKLIRSVSSESVDPDSVDTIIHELIDTVIKPLMTDGFTGK